jgi:hypothetical protein
MTKSLTPSKSIKPSYVSPSKGKNAYTLTIGPQRAPSVLSYGNNSPQGDHVTAYRLVEEGLYNKLSDLSADEVDALFNLENRNLLRERRSALYDYVSSIAVLDLARKESLYLALDQFLVSYNEDRHKKTEIRQNVTAFHDDSTLVGLAYEEALKGQESRFKENGEKIRGIFANTSALLLTFYNKIPLTAFHTIDGFSEGSGDIKNAKTRIDEVKKWIKGQSADVEISSGVLTAKRDPIVEAMNSLIHYPEITDSAKLSEHQAENIDKKGRHNQPRNNDKDTLIMILSRHVHIFFSVHPEIKNTFNANGELIDNFVDKFINAGASKPNWPSFTSAEEIQSIKDGVKDGVMELEDRVSAHHYSLWKESKKIHGYDLDSSEDEEISTKPMTKVAPIKGEKVTDIQNQEIEKMRRKLKELRIYKKVVEENRDKIPEDVQKEIDDSLSSLSSSEDDQPAKLTRKKGSERSGGRG